MRYLLCCVFVLFAKLPPLAAQPGPGGDGRPAAGRSAWFACVSLPGGLENPVKVMSGKNLIDLELPEFMASAAVPVPEDGIIRIVRQVPDPDNPDKPKYIVLAEARIPESVREALILLSPLAKPEGDRVFLTKVQDLADFKGGDRLYINLSDSDISVQLGETLVAVPTRQAKVYSAPKLASATNMPVMYKFYHPEEKKWKLLSASTVVLRPTRREIYVFNNGTRLGTVRNHKILFPLPVAQP